ncbi:MAG: SCO family protein [Planctomycetaceae bacterium]
MATNSRWAYGALIVLVFGVGTLRAEQRNVEDLRRAARFEQKLNDRVPLDLTFRNTNGQTVRLGDSLDGKPVILNLVYFRCPRLCHLTMDGLVRTLRTMSLDVGKDFRVLTISFDPREDVETARRARNTILKRYGRDAAADGWQFLTGEQPQIAALTDAVGFNYAYDPARDQYAHAAGIIILTPDGRIARYLTGFEFAARDLRLSLVEASAGEIGSPTDQVLLLCYQYDPTTGRYGWIAGRLLPTLGILTVVMLGGSVGWMLRQERRRMRRPHQ